MSFPRRKRLVKTGMSRQGIKRTKQYRRNPLGDVSVAGEFQRKRVSLRKLTTPVIDK
jgi:hypothetical protein